MLRRSITTGLRIASFTRDRKSTRLNSSHLGISYAVFCVKKKTPGHDSVLWGQVVEELAEMRDLVSGEAPAAHERVDERAGRAVADAAGESGQRGAEERLACDAGA